jgi:hypothetical protein
MSPRHGTRPNPSPSTSRDKLEVLSEYERLDKTGKGARLSRVGLSTSVIRAWREQRDKDSQSAQSATSRGPRRVDPQAAGERAADDGQRAAVGQSQ